MLIGDVMPLWKIDEAWGRGHNVSVNVCVSVEKKKKEVEEEEEAWCTKFESF